MCTRGHSMTPPRKRQRLSSPIYDDQLGEISLDELASCDLVEQRMSQQQSQSQGRLHSTILSKEARQKRLRALEAGLKGEAEDENPFSTTPARGKTGSRGSGRIHPRSPPRLPSTTAQHATSARWSSPPAAGIRNSNVAQPSAASPSTANAIAASGFTSASHLSASTSAVNAFTPASSTFASASQLPTCGEQSSLSLDDPPPERDWSKWFESDPLLDSTGFSAGFQKAAAVMPPATFTSASNVALHSAAASFQTASALMPITRLPQTDALAATFASASALLTTSSGFSTARSKPVLLPSAEALEKAARKVQAWQDEVSELDDLPPSPETPTAGFPKTITTSSNAFAPTSSPAPAAFVRPALTDLPQTPNTPSPLPGFSRGKAKPFKSPFLPGSPALVKSNFRAPLIKASRTPHPLAATPVTANSQNEAPPSTPYHKPLGLTQRSTPRFVTPFKKTAVSGHVKAVSREYYPNVDAAGTPSHVPSPVTATIAKQLPSNPNRKEYRYFDLNKPIGRVTLRESGLTPQAYSPQQLELKGIDLAELQQITPSLAVYYCFHEPTSEDQTFSQAPAQSLLGAPAALRELRSRGCDMATKPWVDNYWSLILWKLAGMVALDPDREQTPSKRWCFEEVMRQLLYRYERELNLAVRPPLRLIAARDAQPTSPMILCVSNITWPTTTATDDKGQPVELLPELEVTDGWYKLRARIDDPLAKACRRGLVRIGSKLNVSGARLDTTRKDPSEILEAYDNTTLILNANGTRLAPWHAKLGFQRSALICTFHSLAPEGGVVPLMDVVVEKALPVAYIEFIEDEDGNIRREGPRGEKEEMEQKDKWVARWEKERSKLWAEKEKRWSRLQDYAERLEQRSIQFRPTENDDPPSHIDNIFNGLDDASTVSIGMQMLASLSTSEAYWLARHICQTLDSEREQASDEIDREVSHICPPREVRSFRVLQVSDAVTNRRPSNRKAMVTLWDVMTLTFDEGGKAGAFEVGQRYLVSNLNPTQANAWMDRWQEDAQAWLSTRKDTRWKRIRAKP